MQFSSSDHTVRYIFGMIALTGVVFALYVFGGVGAMTEKPHASNAIAGGR